MGLAEFRDPDLVREAIDKAREHAAQRGKPIQLDRVAVFLGVSHEDISRAMDIDDECKDEDKREVARLLKGVKQESRADVVDALSEKGNVTGFIFQGKVNHGMVEASSVNLNVAPVTFINAENIPD